MTRDTKPTPLAERIVFLKTRSPAVRRMVEMLPAWVTPNAVTLFRASLAIPVFWALTEGRYWIALAVFAAAMALDAVDGAIAHVRNMGTAMGAFIDPLADKLLVYGAMLALWDVLPAWITLLIGGSLVFAAALTLVRIVRLIRARNLSGPALAQTVAAKPAGKVKTMFDVGASLLIMAGLARNSTAEVNAGGALIVVGSIVAGVVYASRRTAP